MASIIEPHDCSNVIILAFVTSQARLNLYSVLHPLDKRVLYFDTDTVIYIHRLELWNPTIINNRLGEWTDEVSHGQIMSCVGRGPKNYGYEFFDKQKGDIYSTVKVKGVTLDYSTSQLIYFDRPFE